MKEEDIQQTIINAAEDTEAVSGIPITPFPIRIAKVSGLYDLTPFRIGAGLPAEDAEAGIIHDPIRIPIVREEMRLDVDGSYPQMVASGSVQLGLAANISWVANLKSAGGLTWGGGIWYKNGATASFPYTAVKIVVTRPSAFMPPQSASVTFTGPGISPRTRVLKYRSPYFHKVEFEYDWEKGITPATEIGTYDHPNHPATISNERLSIETVYRRAGFDVSLSGGGNDVGTAPGGYWSDTEMHDAMQIYWSHFANRPQWALWVLFAGLHEGATPNVPDTGLGGIMFDDIGPNERQGTSLFLKSFISQPPAADPNPAAWVKRMFFWTAVHEIGHTFNLAHSWQKALVSGGHGPWIPMANDPQALSFMNYPYLQAVGGEKVFFGSFEYRFTNQELLFLRHAPGRFVEMGNAEWFDNHGFRQAATSASPTFRLEVRANRPKMTYEFLEPITLELKLTNTSQQPQNITSDLLSRLENLTVVTKLGSRTARQYTPMAHYCTHPEIRSLAPGESIYDSLFISADRNGWNMAEPGNYRIQAILHFPEEDIVSAPLSLRITPPNSRQEEVIAQDYFSKEVGHVLTFDGTMVLENANNSLREIVGQFPDSRAARHALVALGNPLSRNYKLLTVKIATTGEPILELKSHKPDASAAKKDLSKALTEHMELSAESLGHIDYRYYVERFADWLSSQGESQQASKITNDLHKVMAARGVIARVLEEIKHKAETYSTTKAGRARA